MTGNCWLLLEKSDETRVSKGIEGYKDRTGEIYRYDSLVPNFKNISVGDAVVLRKETDILGMGLIASIAEEPLEKRHRRCPVCSSTDIRERRNLSPRWKCGKSSCRVVFEEPVETLALVRSFTATVGNFVKFGSPPSVRAVKSCAMSAKGTSSQLSILELDAVALSTVLEGSPALSGKDSANIKVSGQGFGLSQPERRAVEERAMQMTRELYEADGWEMVDTSTSQPYDFLARRGQEERFVEVKGTTGQGQTVILTQGEVAHVMAHPNSSLVLISEIGLERHELDWKAAGGKVRAHIHPWSIESIHLNATQFRYQIPFQ